MRKIEKKMLDAIKSKRDWRNSNTSVYRFDSYSHTRVYLHGILIAIVNDDGSVKVTNCDGWRSNTTKSRLNAVLELVNSGVYQKNFRWYFMHNKSPYESCTIQAS